MLERLDWADWPSELARSTFAQLVNAPDASAIATFEIHGRVAELPFYQHWRLVTLSSTALEEGSRLELDDVLALWRDGRPARLLDGSSNPIHEANADEALHLDEATAPDYLRFFCLFVRADGNEPFYLYEEPPEAVEDDPDALEVARPLSPKSVDPDGRMLFDARMVFTGNAFQSVLAVRPDGDVEMIDDDPLGTNLPETALPHVPVLGLGPLLQVSLGKVLPAIARRRVVGRIGGRRVGHGAPASRAPQAAAKSPMLQYVEVLLERALREQAQNRLVGYFNATLRAANPLDQFAALVRTASPVVIVETGIPFVEETIAEIVNGHLPSNQRMDVHGPDSPADGAPLQFRLPAFGPAIVVMPLQVYRTVAQLERVAFDVAARDLAMIITCQRVIQLPETLRQMRDISLRLPALDPASFAVLFRKIMGQPVPARWQAAGTEWLAHLLPTDFEHPRRMKLSRAKALGFIRAQVEDRLAAVDADQGLSLDDLHGMSEARQFAEDLIADIHAAQRGELPWSEVDRGALLVGAPGTGKTTLARAIAKACGVRFIAASAAGWQSQGESLGPHLQAIRRTFAEARTYAPSILFIDEIDSLGNREVFARDNNAVYQTDVINAVLEEMVALDPTAPVFYIAATNYLAGVDPALQRSGRLDRVIRIPRPTSAGLESIYRYYLGSLEGTTVDPSLDARALGRLSVGLTGADIERVVRGAARRARKARRGLSQIDVMAEITNKPRSAAPTTVLSPGEVERTATHEAGHAMALFLSKSAGSDIGLVTIVPRDGALGFVAPLSDERTHLTREDYEARLDTFLAGRAAEELSYGKDGVSSGACSDLQSATELATRMVTQLGLGGNRRLLWSGTPAPADLLAIESMLDESYGRILRALKKHRAGLTALAQVLADRQEMTGDEVRGVLSRGADGA